MTARMRQLLEARARAWSAVQDIQARRAADGYEPTTEDGEAFTRSHDEVERLSTEIETEERAERLGGAIERSLLTPADGQRGTNPTTGDHGGATGDEPDVAAAYRAAFAEQLRRGDARTPEGRALLEQGFVDASDELRAQGVALLDETPRTGIRGSRVAFVHPRSSGGVLTEIVQPAEGH